MRIKGNFEDAIIEKYEHYNSLIAEATETIYSLRETIPLIESIFEDSENTAANIRRQIDEQKDLIKTYKIIVEEIESKYSEYLI